MYLCFSIKELEKVFVREAVGKVIYILYEMPLRNTQIKSSQYLFCCSKPVLVVIQTDFQPNTEAKINCLRAAKRKTGFFSLSGYGRTLSSLHSQFLVRKLWLLLFWITLTLVTG